MEGFQILVRKQAMFLRASAAPLNLSAMPLQKIQQNTLGDILEVIEKTQSQFFSKFG